MVIREVIVPMLLLISLSLPAQPLQSGNSRYLHRLTVVIDKEQSLNHYLPGVMLYSFPDYVMSRVVFRNGTETTAGINFNLYTDEVFFTAAGSTPMALANISDVRRIVVDTTVWLPSGGVFGRQIYRNGSYAILRLVQTRVHDFSKRSQVGELTRSVVPVSTYTQASLETNNQQHMTLALGEYTFVTAESFILLSENSDHKANAAGFIKMFPAARREIREYVKSNSVDLGDVHEVTKLLDICIKLTER
jgi:hypothetical protein